MNGTFNGLKVYTAVMSCNAKEKILIPQCMQWLKGTSWSDTRLHKKKNMRFFRKGGAKHCWEGMGVREQIHQHCWYRHWHAQGDHPPHRPHPHPHHPPHEHDHHPQQQHHNPRPHHHHQQKDREQRKQPVNVSDWLAPSTSTQQQIYTYVIFMSLVHISMYVCMYVCM